MSTSTFKGVSNGSVTGFQFTIPLGFFGRPFEGAGMFGLVLLAGIAAQFINLVLSFDPFVCVLTDRLRGQVTSIWVIKRSLGRSWYIQNLGATNMIQVQHSSISMCHSCHLTCDPII